MKLRLDKSVLGSGSTARPTAAEYVQSQMARAELIGLGSSRILLKKISGSEFTGIAPESGALQDAIAYVYDYNDVLIEIVSVTFFNDVVVGDIIHVEINFEPAS